MARDMHCRPSTLYAVGDALTAFCLDRGVDLYGRLLEDAVRRAADGAKTQQDGERKARRVLDRWLACNDPADQARPSGFRDPFAEGLVARA